MRGLCWFFRGKSNLEVSLPSLISHLADHIWDQELGGQGIEQSGSVEEWIFCLMERSER